MKHHTVQLATLAILTLAVVVAQATGQQPQSQNPQTQDQAQQPAEKPHVDAQTNPDARQLEKSITDALNQDPHMAYSKVTVHASDSEVVLSGTVLTAAAKDQAAQIATEQAGGRKITNKIRVNPNVHERL